ncbi:hypothetical protein PF011_g32142, partial [Phytophthora fragariae]
LSSLGGKFGSRKEDIYDFKFETTRAFNELETKMIADTDDPAQDVLDAMSDAEYDREMRRLRRLRHEKAEAQVTFAVLQDKLRTYRKRAEKHIASVALGEANFQARQEKAQQERNGEIGKLEKRIADFECKGPWTTFEEFTESEKKRRDCASSSAE